MEVLGGDALEHADGLDHEELLGGTLKSEESGISVVGRDETLERTHDHGVIGGEERDLLPGKSEGPVEGDGESILGQAGESVGGKEVLGREDVAAVPEVLDGDAEVIEHFQHEVLKSIVLVQ